MRFGSVGGTWESEASRVRDRVGDLVELVRTGRLFEANHKFYAPDGVLGEAALPPLRTEWVGG